ncbi:MAG: HD domain-containing protein [Armatimonadota bacterium]
MKPDVGPPTDLTADLPASGAELVRDAWRVAVRAHEGQVRDDGATMLEHVLGVARNVRACAGADPELLAAALLHDVVENTPTPLEQIADRFGAQIAGLVDAVTNRAQEDAEASALRAQASGEPALLLRLCDRLDGIRRSAARPARKRAKFLAASRRVHLRLAQQYFPALAEEMRRALEAAEGAS